MKEKKQYHLILTREELECLDNCLILDNEIAEEIERLISSKVNEHYILSLNYEKLDSLANDVAAEANHAENERKQEILDYIYTKITNLLKYNKQELDEKDRAVSFFTGKMDVFDYTLGYMEKIDNGDFLHDFKVFLRYVSENKIKLTPKLGMIPRKNIHAINLLFRHPHKMEERVGNKIFRVREEFELTDLHFIDILAMASGCVKVTRTDHLRKGKNFTKFFNVDAVSKITNLFLSWFFTMPWDDWFMRGGDFAEHLQGKVKEIAQHLAAVKDKKKIDFKGFANDLIANIDVKWICDAGDENLSHARFGIKGLLIKPMCYFGAVKTYTQKGKYDIDELAAFEFTQPLGTFLIKYLADKTFDPKNN